MTDGLVFLGGSDELLSSKDLTINIIKCNYSCTGIYLKLIMAEK